MTARKKSALRHGGRSVTIVHISAECAPWAQEGALGQAVHELAQAQAALGRPVVVIAPAYRGVREEHPDLVPVGEPFEVALGDRREAVALHDDACRHALRGRDLE